MSDSLTAVFQRGKPVTLGSRTYSVYEARLCDLTDLQAWLDDQFVSPLDGLAERIAGLSEVDADRILFDAYAACEDGPPTYDSIEGTGRLFSAEGIGAFLTIALRRSVSDLATTLRDLASDPPTADQFARLRRVFFGCSDLVEIQRLMRVPPYQRPGKSLAWSQAIYQLIRDSGYVWTLDDVAAMSITEFSNARRLGEPRETGIHGTKATLLDLGRRRNAVLGLDEAETPGPVPVVADDPFPGEWVHPAVPKESE